MDLLFLLRVIDTWQGYRRPSHLRGVGEVLRSAAAALRAEVAARGGDAFGGGALDRLERGLDPVRTPLHDPCAHALAGVRSRDEDHELVEAADAAAPQGQALDLELDARLSFQVLDVHDCRLVGARHSSQERARTRFVAARFQPATAFRRLTGEPHAAAEIVERAEPGPATDSAHRRPFQ